MYPFLRMAKELIKTSLASKLKVTDVHVSHHICWPWDLDTFAELNNGRTLTLFDLGRFGLAQRTGVTDGVLRQQGQALVTATGSKFLNGSKCAASWCFGMRDFFILNKLC